MSYIKINENQFLGTKELNRMIGFLSTDSFREYLKQTPSNFGLVRDFKTETWGNGLVQAGTNSGTIKINELFAVNADGNFIKLDALDNKPVTVGGAWYWVQVTYATNPEESGAVSIDETGNLVGVGTAFTEVLRSIPNRESVVQFTNSVGNVAYYSVANVISDTNATLMGNFVAESGLKYKVSGTFTPAALSPEHKDILQYDSCTVTVVAETSTNTPPSPAEGYKFNLARVKNDGGTITIQDKRLTNVFNLDVVYDYAGFTAADNDIAGVEWVKYDHASTPMTHNTVRFAFGFKSSNWFLSPSTNEITFTGDGGGRWKDANYFTTNGCLNGWRVYSVWKGEYCKITNSVKQGTSFKVTLDTIDIDDFIEYLGGGGLNYTDIVIVPDCDFVTVNLTTSDLETIGNVSRTVPVNACHVDIPALCYDDISSYYVTYSYVTGGVTSAKTQPISDSVGYYNEDSFDVDGILILSPTSVPYVTNTPISVKRNVNSYDTTIKRIDSGDLYGLEIVDFSEKNGYYNLVHGVDKKDQLINAGLTLSYNNFINLSTQNVKDGANFNITLKTPITLGIFKFAVCQDYTSPSSYAPIKQLTKFEADNCSATNGVVMSLTYSSEDGAWHCDSYVEKSVGGDLVGVDVVSFGSVAPTLTLYPGVSKQQQLITSGLTLSDNYYINIDDATVYDGASFKIIIRTPIILGAYNFIIKHGANLIKQITKYEADNCSTANGMVVDLTYSSEDSAWHCNSYLEKIVAADGNPHNNFYGEADDIIDIAVESDYINDYTTHTINGKEYKIQLLNLQPGKKYYRIGQKSSTPINYCITGFIDWGGYHPTPGDEIIIELDNQIPAGGMIVIADGLYFFGFSDSSINIRTMSMDSIIIDNTSDTSHSHAASVTVPLCVYNHASPPWGDPPKTNNFPYVGGNILGQTGFDLANYYGGDKYFKSHKISKFIYTPSRDIPGRKGVWKEISRAVYNNE